MLLKEVSRGAQEENQNHFSESYVGERIEATAVQNQPYCTELETFERDLMQQFCCSVRKNSFEKVSLAHPQLVRS